MEFYMDTQPLKKLTNAYLRFFFKNKNLPYEEWNITIDGTTHVLNNKSVIDSILRATPEHQRAIADAMFELDPSNQNINSFLKHLAFESHCLE